MRAKQSVTGLRRSSVAALMTAVVAGCASMTTTAPEEMVKYRAEAYWKARLANDAESAYGYAAPSYRSAVNLESFRRRHMTSTALTSVTVVQVRCVETRDVCTARTRLEYTLPPMVAKGRQGKLSADSGDTHRDERWIFEDGSWWRYFDPVR